MQVKHTFISPKTEQTDPTLVGPNEWNAPHTVIDTSNNMFVVPDYNFAPYSPSNSLVVGSNTVTLFDPTRQYAAPRGLAIGNSLWVSGGTGTAEAATITAWNPTTGVAIITCAYAHSGAYTITSASAGIQETAVAANAVGGGQLIMPAGNYTVSATVNWYSFLHLKGFGIYTSSILRTGDFGDTILCKQVNNISFEQLQMQQTINYAPGTPGSASNLPTHGAHLDLLGVNGFRCDNVRLQDMYQNVVISGGALIQFFACQFSGTYDGRTGSPKATIISVNLQPYNATYGITTFIRFYGCDWVGSNNGTTATSSNYPGIAAGYNLLISHVEDFEVIGGSMGGANIANILIQSGGAGLNITGMIRIIGVKFDSCQTYDIRFSQQNPSYNAATNVLVEGCLFNDEQVGYGGLGVDQAASGNPPVSFLTVRGNQFFNAGNAALSINDGSGIVIEGNTIASYNFFGNIAGVPSAGVAIGGRATQCVVRNNGFGGSAAFGPYDGSNNKCQVGLVVSALGTTNVVVIEQNYRNCSGALNPANGGDLIDIRHSIPVVFANLPLTPTVGQYATVTDSTINTWGTAITIGGGTNQVLAFFNGTNWTVAGK